MPDPLCPTCNSEMIFRPGKFGDFWGCSKYPDCKGTRDDSGLDKAPDSKKQKKVRQSDKEKIQALTDKVNYWAGQYFDLRQFICARVNKIWPSFNLELDIPDCQVHICPCCGHPVKAHSSHNGPELFNIFKEKQKEEEKK